jgi:hypothetical protein
LTNERHVLVGRDTSELVGAIRRLYTDGALWESLSRQGQEVVRGRFGAEFARATLAAMCANLIPSKTRAT